MHRLGFLRRSRFWTFFLMLMAACNGRGCTGCEQCGIARIPGSFPIEQRIANAAQLRLTESGIEFLEEKFPEIIGLVVEGEGLDIEVPRVVRRRQPLGELQFCENSDCAAHIDVANTELATLPEESAIAATVYANVESRDRAGNRKGWRTRLLGPIGSVLAVCWVDIDTRRGSHDGVALDTRAAFLVDQHEARYGYTYIDVGDSAIRNIDEADIQLENCSGPFGDFAGWIGELARERIIDSLRGTIGDLIENTARERLCQQRGNSQCPTGTTSRGDEAPDAVCYYGEEGDECVPILLGADGRGDLGAQMLGRISPGTHAPAQFALAGGGPAEMVNNGATLNFFGGFMSMDRTYTRSPSHNPCVPETEPPALPEVLPVESFRVNSIPGTTMQPHVGFGISEDYLNYAGWGLFDSGVLCIGVGTPLSQQLTTGILGGLAPSMRALTFPDADAPVSVALRPQKPPTFRIGTDAAAPILTVRVPELEVDFYVWSTERYVRVFTFQTDLTVEVNLTTAEGKLVPTIVSMSAANSVVSNSELITEAPETLARAIESLVGALTGLLGGALDPIAMPNVMGFNFDIPPDGIRGIYDEGESFLGLFGTLSLSTPPEALATVPPASVVPIIRGIPNPNARGGCGCTVAGAGPQSPLATFVSVLLLGMLALRRTRSSRFAAAIAVAIFAIGCDCEGGEARGEACGGTCSAPADPSASSGFLCCGSTDMCVGFDATTVCGRPGYVCRTDKVTLDANCQPTCSECREVVLSRGLLATDLDYALSANGTPILSGYASGDPTIPRPYGDLVFGHAESASAPIDWEVVDGVPSGPIEGAPRGWRGGVSAPGDDVGRWTQIEESNGRIFIAYYDVTHGALKFASGNPGAWQIHTIDDNGDAGRYASMVLLEGGIPAIAYLRIVPASSATLFPFSSVQVATASSATPDDASDWNTITVASSSIPCRTHICGVEGTLCLEAGACALPTTDCDPACGGNSSCVSGTCYPRQVTDLVETMPAAYGLYPKLARTLSGLALVFYDRINGNLLGARLEAGSWSSPFLIDGYGLGDPMVGDCGLGSSLAVDDNGVWHVTYVDAAEETLRYASVSGGIVTGREVVDDGSTDGLTRWADGRHLVGDDSSVAIVGDEIRVTYQDATAQHLMIARKPRSGGAFTRAVLDMENHTGFWARQVSDGTRSSVATWWRQPSASSPETNGVRIVEIR